METQYHIFVMGPANEYDKRHGIECWHDCGEGPWLTFLTAQQFAEAEVGAPWRVVAIVPIVQCI